LNIVKKYKIETNANIIFAKVDLQNYLRKDQYKYIDFFIFCLLELSTNIIKYANRGDIWVIEQDTKFALCALDNGTGIKDLYKAQKSGFTTSNNSLGLGLEQISNHTEFDMEIYTQTTLNHSGTVVLVVQKEFNNKVVFLTKAYMDMQYNGDYYYIKDRYILFGDISGHGLKASKSADEIKEFFAQRYISYSFNKDFFMELDRYIKERHLRSSVLAIVERKDTQLYVSGVGNINCWVQIDNQFNNLTFNNEIVGEVFENICNYDFNIKKIDRLILSTDGIISEKLTIFLQELKQKYSSLMLSLCILQFLSSDLDDSSILIINGVL